MLCTHRPPLPLLLSGLMMLAACVGGEPEESPPADEPRVEGTEPGDCADGADNDADGAFDCDDSGCAGAPDCDGSATEDDGDGDGVPADEDCDDADPASTVVADDGDCDGVPTADDCDDADATRGAADDDADCDGAPTAEDCDDTDASVYPGASEVWGDGVDKDCDGVADVEGASCSATLTLTSPDGSATTLDFCKAWDFVAAFEYDPDDAPEVIGLSVELNATTAEDFQCRLTLTQEGICGPAYYDAREDTTVASLVTLDCDGVADDHETTVALDGGYLRLDALDAGSDPGSFAGVPLPMTVEGRVHVWGGGFDLAGDLALTLRQIAPDGEEGARCVGTDGDADGDGGLAHNFDGDDCADDDPLVYVGAAELDDPTACMADADGDGWGATDAAAGVVAGADCDDADAALNRDDVDGDGASTCDDDCDDADPARDPLDRDADGYSTCAGDCDDADPALDLADADADGYTTCDADCDDADALTHPAGVDTLRDHDCDGAVAVGTFSLAYAEIAIVGPHASACMGYGASSAGDVDGDGLADVLVTGLNAAGGAEEAYLVLGSTLASAGPIVDLATDADYVFDGVGFYILSAAGLGDIDGDGLSDFALGAPFEEDYAGRVYVFLGGSLPAPGTVSVSSADYVVTGTVYYGEAGYVRAVGDLDGDGRDDFAISAPTGGPSHHYVFLAADLGSTRALSASAARRTLSGSEAWHGGVVGLGDLDGDGLGELAIGEFYGATYIVPGSVATTRGSSILLESADAIIPDSWVVAAAGDVDADGLTDLLVGTPDDGRSWFTGHAYLFLGSTYGAWSSVSDAHASFTGYGSADRLGSAVSGAGDLDGDGLGDVLIGAPTSSEAAGTAGRAWLVPGSQMAAAGEVDLALAYSFTGEGAGDEASTSLASAGDIDGDGVPDVLVGSPFHDTVSANEGVVYVLLSGL